MARIIVITSTGEQTVELAPGQTLTVGRDPTNKVPLPDEAGLSRRHCRIGPREGADEGWEVADLGSTNKTRVNGQPIQQRVLSHGDEIEIGSVKIRFEDPDEEKRLEALGKEGVCYLEWVTRERKGERIVLARKRTTVGRREANDVALDDRMVSGHHAEIDRDLNGYTIRDLGSTNGTLVNGQPISENLLTHGARIRIGNARFAFKDPSMKDIEVELAHFEEDEGWGMMGEIDLSRARGSRLGVMAVLLLFVAAGVGGWWLMQREEKKEVGTSDLRAGLVQNGSFDDDGVPWSADREEGVQVRRTEKGGKPGPWLSVRNAGAEGEGLARVAYDHPIETAGSRPLHVRAYVRSAGGDGAELVAVWASEPTPEELKAGVTQLERSDLLAAPEGGWSAVDALLVPPAWARTLRIGFRLPEGAGAGLDALSVTPEGERTEREMIPVRTFKSATIDDAGSLDLVGNRRVLLTGVKPVARLAGGQVLTRFEASRAEVTPEGADLEGAFRSADGNVAATLRWTTTGEGLKAEVACPDAAAVGFDAAAPAQYVGGTVSVLGSFLPQRIPVTEGQSLEKVSRTLVGDPVGGAQGTLIAFVQEKEAPVATLDFLPSRDEGLVRFRHWVEGNRASLDVISDFSKQRGQAEQALKEAKKLAPTAPGRAIQELRNVANAFPFEEAVRDEALTLASKLEGQAAADRDALVAAIEAYGIYRSVSALEAMETIAGRTEGLYLGEAGAGGGLETEMAGLVAQVREARKEHDVEVALPGVARLERIATNLSGTEGYRPIAAVYWRTLEHRLGELVQDAPDIARRLEAARKALDELEKNPDVQEALPPVPKAPQPTRESRGTSPSIHDPGRAPPAPPKRGKVRRMATTGLGVTIGSYSLRAVKLRRKGSGYVVQRVFADRLNDETRAVAGRALAAKGIRGVPATVGLTGRDVIIRYSQVPPVPEWRLRNLMKFEVDEVGSQSGGDVSADYRKLSLPDPDAERDDDTILVALARNAYLDRVIKACGAGGVKVGATAPNSIAIFNAFAVNATYGEDETCLLVNIGSEDIDLAIQQGGELLFARNATPGGAAFTDAIQQAFSTSAGKAEQMKIAKADVTPRGQAKYPDPTSEKVANAIMGVAGQLSSLIQSTLMIARAQAKLPDLKVDRVLLGGGGASLKGLDLYLKQAMGIPVERLNPFEISDLSQLPDDERELAEKAPHEFAVAVGLAQLRLDPLAFDLEVLPAALRRRRDFLTKGIFAAGAAVVALGILGVLYQGRVVASEQGQAAMKKLGIVSTRAESQDGRFRDVLRVEQELAVKHQLLGDVLAPGALLAKTWSVLEDNLSAMRDVYLESVQLRVEQNSNEFPYYKERRREKASGYEETSRRFGFRRDPSVIVRGRIAGKDRADQLFADFVRGCEGNKQGLLVEPQGRMRPGNAGRDATFELLFRPGRVIEIVIEDGADPIPVTLTDLSVDDPEEPAVIRGRRADGVRVEIPIDEEHRATRRKNRELIEVLTAEAAAAAAASVAEDETDEAGR